MATYTTNLALEKPIQSEVYDIGVFNQNADKIDEYCHDTRKEALYAQQMLAPAFNTDSAYVKGQRVTYEVPNSAEPALFEFIQDHPIGAWDGTHVKQIILGDIAGTMFTGTLTAGQTSITFSSTMIKATSILEFYTSVYGVNPTAVSTSVSAGVGSVTLTFEAQADDMTVAVKIVG